jgi:hypothetical protein
LHEILLRQDDEPGSWKVALFIAVVFHIVLISVTFPSVGRQPVAREETRPAVHVNPLPTPPPPRIERRAPVAEAALNPGRMPMPDPTPEPSMR